MQNDSCSPTLAIIGIRLTHFDPHNVKRFFQLSSHLRPELPNPSVYYRYQYDSYGNRIEPTANR